MGSLASALPVLNYNLEALRSSLPSTGSTSSTPPLLSLLAIAKAKYNIKRNSSLLLCSFALVVPFRKIHDADKHLASLLLFP